MILSHAVLRFSAGQLENCSIFITYHTRSDACFDEHENSDLFCSDRPCVLDIRYKVDVLRIWTLWTIYFFTVLPLWLDYSHTSSAEYSEHNNSILLLRSGAHGTIYAQFAYLSIPRT